MKKRYILELTSVLLFALCGGFSDAYTFLQRGGVYANMQTGNLVRFTITITEGRFEPSFFFPMVLFCLGVLISVFLKKWKHHEIAALSFILLSTVVAAFFPVEPLWTIICVSMLSVSGAMQFALFHECSTTYYTSTMCTNNMRLFVENTVDFVKNKNNKKGFFFLSILLVFALGVASAALLGQVLGQYTILISSGIYAAILVLRIVIKTLHE